MCKIIRFVICSCDALMHLVSASSLLSMGGGRNAIGKSELGGVVGGCERARRVCKVSVQGGEMSLWGWGAAVWLPLAASLHKSTGEWWVGVGGLGM